MKEQSPTLAALRRVSGAVGLVGSLVLHASLALVLTWSPPLPTLDFELELPSEVDFGIPEPASDEAIAPAPEASAEPATSTTAQAPATNAPAPRPEPPKPEPLDASTPEPEESTDAGAPDASAPDARAPNADAAGQEPTETQKPEPVAEKPDKPKSPAKPGAPVLAAFAPKGSQLNLRLDLIALRASPLSEDVRHLLLDAPDVRAVIDGSGIDALRDLDRLFLASPDLRRAHVVIAGQHALSPELPQRAVATLATAAAKAARWRERGGIMTAPWHNRDETERVVALLSKQQFVISPAKDLTRVLAVARSLENPSKAAGKQPAEDSADSALLALDEGVVAMLTVLDARRFARGNVRGIPVHIEVTAKLLADGGVAYALRGEFESQDAAQSAVTYWQRTRERYASHPLVALIGLRTPLTAATIRSEGSVLWIEGALTQQQSRMLLGFARSSIAPPTPAPLPPISPPVPPSAMPPSAVPGPSATGL